MAHHAPMQSDRSKILGHVREALGREVGEAKRLALRKAERLLVDSKNSPTGPTLNRIRALLKTIA